MLHIIPNDILCLSFDYLLITELLLCTLLSKPSYQSVVYYFQRLKCFNLIEEQFYPDSMMLHENIFPLQIKPNSILRHMENLQSITVSIALIPRSLFLSIISHNSHKLHTAVIISRQPHEYYFRLPCHDFPLDYGDPTEATYCILQHLAFVKDLTLTSMSLNCSHKRLFKKMCFLTHLYLNCCRFKAQAINNIIPSLKRVQQLLIDDPYQQFYDSSINLLYQHSPKIQHVYIQYSKIIIQAAKLLLQFPKMQYLDVRGCRNFCHKELFDYKFDINPSIILKHDYEPHYHGQFEPYHHRGCPYIRKKRRRYDVNFDDEYNEF